MKENIIANYTDGEKTITLKYRVNDELNMKSFLVSDNNDLFALFYLNRTLPYDRAYSLAFEDARKVYNKYVPDDEAIPFN